MRAKHKNLICILVLAALSINISIGENDKIDSLKSVLRNSTDTTKVKTSLNLVSEYKNINIDSAFHYAELALKIIENANYEKGLGLYYLNLAELYKKRSLYVQALKYYDKSLALFEKAGYYAGIGEVYIGIGDIHEYQNNDSVALSYYKKSIEIAEKTEDKFLLASNFNNIGAILKVNDPDEAIDYFNKAISIYKEIGDTTSIATCYNNLGVLHSIHKNYKKSEDYFNSALKIKRQNKNKYGEAISLNNLAYLYYSRSLETNNDALKTELLFKSIDYAKGSLQLSDHVKSIYTLNNSYGILTQAYSEMSNTDSILKYQSSFLETKDSIYNYEKTKIIKELDAKYQIKFKEKEIAQLENDKKLVKTRSIFYLTIIFSFLIISVIITLNIIIRRKKDRLIFNQRETLMLKEKEISDYELEQNRKKEEELVKEIEYKTRQLNTHALNMIQKNKNLEDVKEELSKIYKKSESKTKKEIHLLINKIKISQKSEKEWNRFKMYFEELDNVFYQKLEDINENLSENDKRMCALIKLNMNSKEIGQVLNISPNSVKSARYRLKKRLMLSQDEDLEVFIRGL